MSHETPLVVAEAIREDAEVRTVLLSETEVEESGDFEVAIVPSGTKLSKIRRIAKSVSVDLFCICDPDLNVDNAACRHVVQRGIAEAREGREVVAFGIVEGLDNGTLLSRVIIVDKWLSHRVLRRFLWKVGIGITLPGQFLVVSAGLLDRLDPQLDSYLDDLYLGWLARSARACVHRVPVVVGGEYPRASWLSLLIQRLRWMRGLVCLTWHLSRQPAALGLLAAHLALYHILPIFVFVAVLALAVTNPASGFCVFLGLAAAISIVSRQTILTTTAFLVVFPLIHGASMLTWWIPIKRSFLTRR